jgi:hypothetical protein
MSRKKTKQTPKRVLGVPNLDVAKSAVLNTLRSSESKRSYRFAFDDFVGVSLTFSLLRRLNIKFISSRDGFQCLWAQQRVQRSRGARHPREARGLLVK